MKVLVISNSPWDDSNSFGSTFTNFFKDSDFEIASIYCSGGMPNTKTSSRFFRLSETALSRSILKRKEAGEEVFISENEELSAPKKKGGLMNFVRNHRWTIFFWAREFLWKAGKWKGKKLDDFINSFNPDIIVLPTYSFSYINKLALYIQKKWNLPMVSYVSDDEYTLRQFSLSPLYWINRLIQRKGVKRGIENSKILYTISNIQKEDYEKVFTTPCKVLTKFSDFDQSPEPKESFGHPLKIVYTGNIGGGRWKSLSIIAKAIRELNVEGQKAFLQIYTATPITGKMKKALNIPNCSQIMGKVSSSEVSVIQKEADILVHVEAMDLRNRLIVRQSFSTKIVDYFKMTRPILAVGPKDVASIKHLLDNDCAMVCATIEEVKEKLSKAILDHDVLIKLSLNGYKCGRKHHNKSQLQTMFYNDLKDIVEIENK